MFSANQPFRILVYNGSGTLQGELTGVQSVDTTVSLDRVGRCTFTVIANQYSVRWIVSGASFDIYTEKEGYIGRFYLLDFDASYGFIRVNCEDELTALLRYTVGFRRDYNFDAVDTVIADLLSVAGWSGVIDSGIGNTSVTFEGESILAAVDVLRDRWGVHYRRSTIASSLDFGAFGDDSGVLFTNLSGQVPSMYSTNNNAYSFSENSFRRNEDASEIYNRIIATGGGQGEAEFTIENSVVGSYTVNTGTNLDGSNYFYIEDAASIALYGLRTKVVKFTGIRALSNNDTDIQRAKDAVKYAAETYLRRHKDPIVEISLSVVDLRANVRVGDLVTVVYRAVGDDSNIPYIDVNAQYYVMDISTQRDTKGGHTSSVELCSTDDRRTADTDVMVDVIRDVEVLKLHIQPYPFRYESTGQDYVGKDQITLANRDAVFKLEVDNTITKLTKVRLRFKTRPLIVNQLIASPATSPWSVVYNIIEGDQHPKGLNLLIDGVNVSSTYGGPWNERISGTPGFSWAIGEYDNNELNVNIDITDSILNSPYGIYADHDITFRVIADRNSWSYIVPGHGATSSFTGDATSGIVECNLRVQGIATGIVPT